MSSTEILQFDANRTHGLSYCCGFFQTLLGDFCLMHGPE